MLTVGGLLALLAGLAFLVETAGVPQWLAFVVVGLLTMAGGVYAALRAIRLLGAPDLAFPDTVAELRRDSTAFRRAAEPGLEGAPREAFT